MSTQTLPAILAVKPMDRILIVEDDRAVQKAGNDIVELRAGKRFADETHGAVPIPIYDTPEKLFLVAKCGIDAGAVDSHCFGQVGHGGPLVALAPENSHSRLKRGLFFKATWPSRSVLGLLTHSPY